MSTTYFLKDTPVKMLFQQCYSESEVLLTNWIPGFGAFRGLIEWSETNTVLCLNSEQVVLSIAEILNNTRLAGTCCVDLGPGFAIHGFPLNPVALDSVSSVILWWFPGQLACPTGDISYLKISDYAWQICQKKRINSYLKTFEYDHIQYFKTYIHIT